jgi:hypothetical protein
LFDPYIMLVTRLRILVRETKEDSGGMSGGLMDMLNDNDRRTASEVIELEEGEYLYIYGTYQ